MKVQYLVASMMLFYIIRLVEKINVSIGQDHNSRYLIGVLVIYGFESFKTNSFEQFCINYTNEKLQQHFNQHVFKIEQEEYSREQIDLSYIEFIDNKDVLDLIEKKPGGIIALLDEACMFPKSTHETFSQKLYQTFRSHQRFFKPKLSRTGFTIAHYAGEVQYQSEQFLDKNKDYVVPEHQDMLTASKCFFISGLFPPLPDEATKSSNKSSKLSSIGARFKFEDFHVKWAFETLERYRRKYCMFNDDIQVTAGVALAGLLGVVRAQGRPISDFVHQKIVVVGAGSARLGVLKTAYQAVSRMTITTANPQFYLIDKDGLITKQRSGVDPSAAPFAKAVAEVESIGLREGSGLLDVVKNVKPHVLLGLSGVGGIFNEQVLIIFTP